MRRREALACLASALAGCSGRKRRGEGAEATVTPAPVPRSQSTLVTEAGRVAPVAVADAHVEALSGSSARAAVEYLAGREEAPLDLVRIVATVEDDAFTHRRFDVRRFDTVTVTRTFRGLWYDDGEAVVRIFDEGNQSITVESDDFTPPSAADRFDRDRVAALLSAFDPTARAAEDGYELSAETVAVPERLPTREGLDVGSNGELSGRLGADGVIRRLSAAFSTPPRGAVSESVTVTYRLAVTDRGTTAVERPDPTRTLEWYRELKNRSPVPEGPHTPVDRSD